VCIYESTGSSEPDNILEACFGENEGWIDDDRCVECGVMYFLGGGMAWLSY
jgi:hypothetical protein